jgi:hypothetical protein
MRVTLFFTLAALLSLATEAITLPRAAWRRTPLAWAVHLLAVLFLYALFMLLSARPGFSALCTAGLLAGMAAISNPKFATLREPFVFSDLALYVQALRYPRFYLPFVDLRVIVAEAVGIATLALLWWLDRPVAPHPWWQSLLVMAFCLAPGYGIAARLPLTPDVAQDQRRHGFFAVFVACLLKGLHPSTLRNFRIQADHGPFADDDNAPACLAQTPDVIVIQSESYFDARGVSAAIDPKAWTQFDRACRESVAWGDVTVPAWGANTMRPEFSFLTGLAPEKLGCARFYPYLYLRRACASLPGWLQRRGYQTLAMHPYHADFFGRNRVFPLLHFDQFLDITHFGQAPRAGPYVADAALTHAILTALEAQPDQAPRLIFAITMENHGPLHLETVSPGEAALHHSLGEDPQWAELTIYLRHLANADAALGVLLDHLQTRQRPTVVCFYGDHVPALSKQFDALGVMPRHSAYFIWRNFGQQPAARQDVPVEALGPMTLTAMQGAKKPPTAAAR